jgi:hypothetical protein
MPGRFQLPLLRQLENPQATVVRRRLGSSRIGQEVAPVRPSLFERPLDRRLRQPMIGELANDQVATRVKLTQHVIVHRPDEVGECSAIVATDDEKPRDAMRAHVSSMLQAST